MLDLQDKEFICHIIRQEVRSALRERDKEKEKKEPRFIIHTNGGTVTCDSQKEFDKILERINR